MADLASLQISFTADISELSSALNRVGAQSDALAEGFDRAAHTMAAALGQPTDALASLADVSSATSAEIVAGNDRAMVSYDEVGAAALSASDEISASASHGGGSLLDLASKAGMVVFGFQALAGTAKSLATGLLGPAIQAEEVASSLQIFTGSAQKAQQELQQLSDFAAHTPFETAAIDDAALKMQSVGINAQDVIPYVTALGDALDATGRISSADLGMIVDDFDKIKTTGHLTTDVMNSFALQGIDAWGILEKQTGKSRAELGKMISAGLYPANQAMRDLTAGIEASPLYKGQMANDAANFTGALSTLKSNFANVLAQFGSPIIKAIEPLFNNLSAALAKPAFKEFAGNVGQGIVNVFKFLGDALGKVGGLVASLHLGDLFGQIGKALGGLSSNSALTGFLSSLKDGFGQVGSIVGGTLKENFKTFGAILADLGKWWQTTMQPAIAAVMPAFERLGKIIATTVVPAFAQIWAVGQQVMRTVLPPLSKAFETIAPVIVKVAGFLADQLGQALKTIMPVMVQAAQAIGHFAEEIFTKAEPIVEGIWNTIKGFLDWIGPYWPAIWKGIQAVFTVVWDSIKGVIQIAWSIVSGIIKVGLDLLSGNWKAVWDDIKGIFSGVWDGIKTIASGIWNFISTPLTAGINAFKRFWSSTWNEIKGVFAAIWNSIKSIGEGIWNGLSSAIKGGINFVIGLINDFIGGIDSIGIDVGPVHVHPNIPKIPYLATGGYVPPGGVAIAGEAGPELVFGGASGASVVSTRASQAALSGRQEVHVHVYLDGRELTHTLGRNIVSLATAQGPIRGVA